MPAGRPRFPDQVRRSKAILVRLTPSEFSAAMRLARKSNMPLATWLRMIAVKAAENSS